MSDWEDCFGSGVSAESVMGSINASWQCEQDDKEREANAKWWNQNTDFGRTDSDLCMEFSNYEEMKQWDAENPSVSYIRKRWGQKFIMKVTAAPDGWLPRQKDLDFPYDGKFGAVAWDHSLPSKW